MRQEIAAAIVISMSQLTNAANRRPPENIQKAFSIIGLLPLFSKNCKK